MSAHRLIRLPVLRRTAVAIVLAQFVVALLPATPAAAGHTARARAKAKAIRAELSRLRGEAARLAAELERAAEAHQQAVTVKLSAQAAYDDALADRAEAADRLAGRARALYVSGGHVALYASLLEASSLHDAFARYAAIGAVVSVDRTQVAGSEAQLAVVRAAQGKLRKATDRTRAAEKVLDAKARRMGEILVRQEALLAQADADVRAAIEADREAARRAALARATTFTSGAVYRPDPSARYACPVNDSRSFVDTWGAPRSGGRRHQGTDVFGTYGSPLYAVANGVVDKWGNGGLGGLTLWLRADNGDRFYYAHNSANLAPVGTRVKAGDVIARLGDSGNARGTPPHLHFEAHPGGGAAANPYPFLAAVCPD